MPKRAESDPDNSGDPPEDAPDDEGKPADPGDDDAGGEDSDGTDDGTDPAVTAAEEKAATARRESAQRRRELKPWKDLAREFNLTPDQVRERLSGKAAETAEVDAEAIRREATRDASAVANKRIVRAEVKALAADLFADPGDAPLFVDLAKYEVDDDGAVDEDEIRDDLRAVLVRKPHLGAVTVRKAPEPRTPKPDPSQGSGRGPAPTGAERGIAEAERRYGKQTIGT